MTATGPGVSFDLSGTANTAAIRSGTATLETASPATVNGSNGVITLKGGDTCTPAL